MGRMVAAVVSGYVLMLVVVFVLTMAAYAAIGGAALQPGSYDATMMWVGAALGCALIGGLFAGYATATFSRGDSRARTGLVVLIAVMGVLFAVPVLRRPATSPARPEGAVTMQAITQSRQPLWVAVLLPLLGAAGAAAGWSMRKRASIT